MKWTQSFPWMDEAWENTFIGVPPNLSLASSMGLLTSIDASWVIPHTLNWLLQCNGQMCACCGGIPALSDLHQ